MAGTVEHPSILPRDAHVVTAFLQFVNAHAMVSAPLGAVKKEHIGRLGTENPNAREVVRDEIAGEINVPSQYPA